MIVDQEPKDIQLTLLYQDKKVFSGHVDDLPDFFANEKPVDKVKIYSAIGSNTVAFMCYRDLKMLFDIKNEK